MGIEHSKKKGSEPNILSNELDAGVKINPESDGFRIKSTGPVKQGDTLLVSYEIPSKGWQRLALEYQDEPKGMFIFTGVKPTSVYVICKKHLEEAHAKGHAMPDVPRTVYQSRNSSPSLSIRLLMVVSACARTPIDAGV